MSLNLIYFNLFCFFTEFVNKENYNYNYLVFNYIRDLRRLYYLIKQ